MKVGRYDDPGWKVILIARGLSLRLEFSHGSQTAASLLAVEVSVREVRSTRYGDVTDL